MLKKGCLLVCLLLTACGAPTAPVVQGPMTAQSYSQAVLKLYQGYNKGALEGSLSSPQVLGTALGATLGDVGRSLSIPAVPAAPSLPVAPPPSASDPPAAEPGANAAKLPAGLNAEALSGLFEKLFDTQDRLMLQMANNLKQLSPPAELQQKHSELIQFFELGSKMMKAMGELVKKQGHEAIVRGNPVDKLDSSLKADMERLQALAPQAQQVLLEFQLEPVRQARLLLQAPQELSLQAYADRLKQELNTGNPFSSNPLLEEMMRSLLPQQGNSTSQQAVDLKAREQTLSRMHPPKDYEMAHTALIGLVQVNQELQALLSQKLKNLERSPAGLLALLADADLLLLMQRASSFAAEADKLQRLIAEHSSSSEQEHNTQAP